MITRLTIEINAKTDSRMISAIAQYYLFFIFADLDFCFFRSKGKNFGEMPFQKGNGEGIPNLGGRKGEPPKNGMGVVGGEQASGKVSKGRLSEILL
jgi:hypothetical protein